MLRIGIRAKTLFGCKCSGDYTSLFQAGRIDLKALRGLSSSTNGLLRGWSPRSSPTPRISSLRVQRGISSSTQRLPRTESPRRDLIFWVYPGGARPGQPPREGPFRESASLHPGGILKVMIPYSIYLTSPFVRNAAPIVISIPMPGTISWCRPISRPCVRRSSPWQT